MATARDVAEQIKKKKKTESGNTASITARQAAEKIKKYSSVNTDNVNDEFLNSFFTDASNFLGNAKVEENSYNTWQDLSSRANTIKAWTWKNRDNLEKESYKSLNDSLSAFDSAAEYWNQFKTPEEYNEFWKEYSSYYNKWGKYADAEDYAQNSKYVSTRTDVDINDAFNFFSGMYNTSQLFGDFNYDYINRNPDAGVVASSNNAKTGATALGVSNNFIEEMTDNEIGIYNYLYATQSPEAAKEFLKDIEGDLTRRQRAKSEEYFRNYAKESPVGSSVFSILTSPLKGLSYVGQTADYLQDGKIDQNAGYNKFSYSNSAIRNEVSKDMSGVGNFLYNTGMSIGDFLYATAITGGFTAPAGSTAAKAASAASMAIMGTGAAADTVIASKDMGLSDNQAWILGTAAGAIEAATEKSGIDAMLDKKLLGESIGKYILKNVLAEGMEEGLSNIGNTVVELIDLAFSGDESKIKREIAMIMQEQGISESEAVGKYISGWFKEFGLDVLGGALSGGAVGGGGVAIHTAFNKATTVAEKNKQATQLYGDSTADLVSEALDLNPNNKYAQKMQNKLESGKKLSGGQINRLIDENEAIIRNSAKVEETSDDSQANTTNIDSVESPSPTPQNTAQETETTTTTENTTAEENTTESEFKASEDVSENETVDNAATLEEASKKYGAQAQAMIHTYNKGQDVYKYDSAYKTAYDMGKSGVSLSYAKNSKSTAYLTDSQKELAYEAGKSAADTTAQEQDAKNKSLANGKTGRKKGTVKGEGVTISDLRKSFNDTQNKAYKILSTYAEVTGIDIVLYKSETDEDGNFIGSQGKFKWKEDTIYIDVNAGLTNIKDVNDLAKYTMLRTFSHEFTHFIEKWNPIWYNEFRKVVFDTLTERGENVHDLIEAKMSMSEEMTYDEASREVVAEAMTDILPDANFVENLAANHKNIFDKLLDKLKEFLADLKEYFKAIGDYSSREAKALKNEIDGAVHYVENIVKLFDKVALEAVENYQKTVAIEEKAEKIDSTVTNNDENISKSAEKVQNSEKSLFEKYNDIKQKYPNNIVLYRVGDFFEVLGEDAKTVAEWAGLTLTGRNDPNTGRVPMVGFPFHMLEKYVDKVRRHQSVTLVQEENGIIKEYPMAALETPPKKETISKAEITTSESDSFTITDNAEFGTLEIKFDGKPSEDIRNVLKEHKFRWHSKKGVWYGKADRAEIVKDLQEAYQSDIVTEKNDTTAADKSETKEIGKTARTKKSDWSAHDVEWYIPGKKTPIAYSTVATSELIEALSEQYPNATISQLMPSIKYDEESKKVVQQYINAGYGEQVAYDWFVHDRNKKKSITPTENTTNVEEVTTNGENANNERPILEPDTDGERASRLLDEPQIENVRGASSERNSLGDTQQRESETSRNGDRADTADRVSGSNGDGEVGDLRRNDELTEQENQTKAEQLSETVEKEIEQKSTVKPKGDNFVIGDSLNLPNGEKAKFRANVDVIKLIKQLEAEGRYATTAEQEILSKYVGWGGLDKAFGENRYNRETRKSEMVAKDGWEKEFAELKSLVNDGIITEQEYKNMSASTTNAYYTSIEVIKAMYDGLASLGFKGGRMLEPSSGVGNFVGAMPTDMTAKVNSWTMVELDRITGLIAKYLYPNADVRIQGFENANIPDNYMDVAIGNVPFGNFGVVDKSYPNRITKAIHNYFFAKSIDKVRPGGIVMFITSSFTMNSENTAIRQYIMDRADLLGAIRLPNTAFKGNAGTEVVADILVLKKRESGTQYAGEDFLNADYDSNYGTYTSNYFKNHPEMVLGKPVVERGMYGRNTLTFNPFTDRGTIDEQIREAFKNIKGKMDYPAKRSPEKTNFAVEKATKKTKSGGFVVNSDGTISKSENGQLVKYDTDEKTAKRIAGMLSIRDAYRTLANYLQQGQDAKYVKQARTALNKAYDTFVKEYGYINSPTNRKAIDSDPDSYSILSLENYDAKKKTAKKADIFTKDTISANKTITHVDNVEEGVIASINLTGGVDVSLIAKLTDKTAEDVTRDIIDSRLAFKDRNNNLIARETYLSGNVRAKLREAESLVPFDSDYNNNIEELRKVIPTDIPYNEIYITPGATFIPNEIYADFIAHMLGGRNNPNSYSGPDVEVGRTLSGEFKINVNNKRLKNSYYNTQTWGTARKSFLDLIDAMMGSRTIKVNDVIENADGKKVSVVNEAETEAANEKAKAIQKEFEDWIWKDENRRSSLARLYNETFNAIVNPKYDGSHLSVNGINAEYSLREHQANAVHRIIASGGNTLLAHRVGAGKTLEMAAAAMKMRELGVIKKPVFVVPKSVVAQWGVEFHNYFPAARLLVADDKSFTPDNRKIFTNKIANGDYDAVIVSYEQFEKIPMSVEYQARFYEEQINEIIDAIAEEKAESRDGKGLTVKEMEKKRAQLDKKLKELTSKPKDENNVDFEMLGIDSLFVDEAHNFKNLEYVSKMTNVAGLGSTKGAQRSFDLYTKIRYLQELNGGRGVVFATATPVMNSMVELYIMQRYLQPDVLNQLGLKSFDAWAKQFGEVVNKWEINPSGTGMRQKQVFANFQNLNELQLLFRSFADVMTEVPGLKIPKMKGGAVKIIECEPGEFQKNYMQELQKRAENVKNVDPSEDNMLKITSDGRKVSYTQRMIDPTLPYEPESKIFKASENILKEYQDSTDIKGTQIVFLDMATPKGTDKSKADTDTNTTDDGYDEESARLYDDMRDYLVKKGIPKREIAFIHEADSDAKRKQLFEDVNNGKVRVLIGSTGKMGVGMNAQKRVVAIHHLDAPWRPGDVEQRDGRAFRQKNMNEEVSKYVYVTKGSFDSRLWDILDRKQHFINQIMNGEDVGRTAEDTGEVTLSAAEVKALASGNPLIEEQTKLTDEIKKLENLQKAYNSSIRLAKTKLSDDETKLTNFKNRISRIREDIATRVDTYSEGKFSMTVGKQVFSDKKEAGAALAAAIVAKANADSYATVGKFAGFELRVIKNGTEYNGLIHGKESYKFNIYLNNTTRMVNHIGEIIAGFENMIKNTEQMITETTADRDAQNNILAQPFEKQDELNTKRARFNEVMELLAPKTEEQLGKTDTDTIQEQSRAYLEEDIEQEQQRTNTLTDREVLEIAAEDLMNEKIKVNGEMVDALSQAEKDALTIFQNRLSKLKDLQAERAEQGRLYKEQQFGEKVDKEKATETLNRMHILDDQIKKATSDVLTVEEKEVLKRVLKKARKVVEVQERQHGQEILKRWRERRDNAAAIKKYRDRLRGDVDELSNWILNPNNKDVAKHVPDVLKNTVVPFLSSINFMSKRALKGGAATKADEAFMNTLKKLNAAIKTNIDAHGLYSGYNDLPPNFMERLQTFIDSTEALVKKNSGNLVINQMTSAELKELSQVVRTLKKYIMQVNRFHYNAMYEHVYEAGENSIEYLQKLGNAGNTSAVSAFLLWQQIRPAYAFERFGDGGIAIYDGLRRGQAKLAFNTKEIQEFSEKTYTEKEVKAWENEIKTFSFGGDIVKMPVSYIMAFYELSKDPEALEHIKGEGIRIATYTNNGKKISDTGHILTVGDFNKLIGSLTDRQKEVADSLQKYMATQGGKWGNYVSVARFGEELFTNPHYFPINSDGRHLQANADEHPSAAALYALLNMSFTKSRKEGANNRIVIYSIFDVFANHMASMAQYNAMALPILDALKWFNYQQVFIDADGTKHIGDSVRERMDRAYGVPEETRPGKGKSGYAQDFVMNIIKAFNGTEAQGTPYDSLGLKSLHRYNVSQVAYNLRVVVQQPLAITRAGMLIDYTSILKGLKLKPSAIKKNIEEMQKYSGIAAWKSLGFYDVNVSRGLTHIIKHDSNAIDKISDVGMWGAEKADLMTWAAIWSAAKAEVTKKQHLTPESDGFYEKVTKLFEDVIYKTQVVDSILTKNEFMRDKGTFARLVGSFMSEPTTNASMLIDAYDKYALDIQRGMTKQQAWQRNGKMIGRRLYVYAVGGLLLAAVQAAADALRDDDDYEEWYEKWFEAFAGNFVDELMPFNKLPILSDFYDLAKELLSIFGVDTYGNPPQSVFMQWYDSLIKGVEIINDKITSADTNYTWYGGIYKLLQALSGITGLPMASATRELITAWNNTIGAMAPSLKVKNYEPSDMSQIRYAYEDGYLTADEAVKEMFSLTSKGYSEENIRSQAKSQIGEWYSNDEISKQQTVNMLDRYFDMESDEIDANISYWDFKNDNPDIDVNIGWFEKYYSDIADSGISIEEYVDYRNKVKDISGEDKKSKRMKIINSLPISKSQKDALYLAEGWSESKLYEAPWH